MHSRRITEATWTCAIEELNYGVSDIKMEANAYMAVKVDYDSDEDSGESIRLSVFQRGSRRGRTVEYDNDATSTAADAGLIRYKSVTKEEDTTLPHRDWVGFVYQKQGLEDSLLSI